MSGYGLVVAFFHPYTRELGMAERKYPRDARLDEIIRAFERERETAHDLHRRHSDSTRDAHERDQQVFIERRKHPR